MSDVEIERLRADLIEAERKLTLAENTRVYLDEAGQRLTTQRDAAEDRFVKMRDQHDELEQEMADLRLELAGTQRLLAREKAMNADINSRCVTITIRPLWTRILDYWRQ